MSFAVTAYCTQLTAQSTQPTAQSPSARLLDSARTLIAQATPAGDVDAFRDAQALLQRVLVATPNDSWALHYLGFALYREATVRMGRDRDDVSGLLERADSILELSAKHKAIAETHGLRASVLGMMIGSNPFRGMTLGPRSGAQMERALEIAPENPRVWLMRGIGAMNTPTMFGGGLDKAEAYLKKAIELFANDRPQPPAPSWGLSEAHAWLGQVYAKQNRLGEARDSYEKALAIEPNDMWVRMILLPALERKQR